MVDENMTSGIPSDANDGSNYESDSSNDDNGSSSDGSEDSSSEVRK